MEVWIARDSDGCLTMYQTEPTYGTAGSWEPTGDDPTIEFVELGPMTWPDIKPAQCVKFELKMLIEEVPVCQACLGSGTVFVDYEHPQWVRCGCSMGPCSAISSPASAAAEPHTLGPLRSSGT